MHIINNDLNNYKTHVLTNSRELLNFTASNPVKMSSEDFITGQRIQDPEYERWTETKSTLVGLLVLHPQTASVRTQFRILVRVTYERETGYGEWAFSYLSSFFEENPPKNEAPSLSPPHRVTFEEASNKRVLSVVDYLYSMPDDEDIFEALELIPEDMLSQADKKALEVYRRKDQEIEETPAASSSTAQPRRRRSLAHRARKGAANLVKAPVKLFKSLRK